MRVLIIENHRGFSLIQPNQLQMDSEEKIVVLSNLQGIFFDSELKQKLFKHHKIVCKEIGINRSTKNMGQFMVGPYLIDSCAVCYLYQNKLMLLDIGPEEASKLEEKIKEDCVYAIYKSLIEEKNLYILDGHKFGAHFLAYEEDPEKNHAKYLVFCQKQTKDESIEVKQKNRISRLTGICKKKGLLVKFHSQHKSIDYTQIEPYKRNSRSLQKKQS